MRFSLLFAFLIMARIGICQCPEITQTTTNPNCIPDCQLCAGDQLNINAQGGDLPNNGFIDYYADTNPGFNPYLGQGTKIGSAGITTANPPCRICPVLLGFMIDACGTEAANEFIIMWTGSGFNTSNFNFDFATQNNTGGAANADIGPGGCSIGAGPSGLVGGCSAISVGANFNLPPNSIWIIFTSSAAFTTYDFSSVCNLSCKIYVSASTCARTIGAFSNFDASPGNRTQVMTITSCACSTNAMYDVPGSLTGNGDFWAEGSISNSGCAVPGLSPPAYFAAPSTIQLFNYQIPQNWCDKTYEIVGIPNPKPDAMCCPEIFTERISVEVKCPKAFTANLEACETNNGQSIFYLEDAENTILGGGAGVVEFYRDMAGTQKIQSPFTSGNATIYARVLDGNCKSNIVALVLKVNLLPVAKASSAEQCDEGPGTASFDLSKIETAIKNGNAGTTVSFFSDPGGSNPISSPYETSSTIIYASIFNGKCESKLVPVTLTVIPLPTAQETTKKECPGLDGKAQFKLTDLVKDIIGNQTGVTVKFYEDDLLFKLITPPYSTKGDTIYAVVSNGKCQSEAVKVILSIIDLNTVIQLSDKKCDDGNGTASFDLIAAGNYFRQGDTSIKVSWFADSMRTKPINPPVMVNGIDTVYGFLKKDSCESVSIPVILEAVKSPVAMGLDIELCSDTSGWVNINLDSLKSMVNGGSGLDVFFSEDSLLTVPAGPLYSTKGTTLYAVAANGSCQSSPVPIVIKSIRSPFFSLPKDTIACDYFILPGIKGYYLTANASYFDSSLQRGSKILEGDSIKITRWIYLFDSSSYCFREDSFRVVVQTAPQAGSDNSTSVCEGHVINLKDLLSNADDNGYFIDLDASGQLADSLFDTKSLSGGSYRFLYVLPSDTICRGDTAGLSVRVEKKLSAGNDIHYTLCEKELVDLDSILLNANQGGVYFDPLNTGALSSDTWDSQISGPGQFQLAYIVGDGQSCPYDTASINLVIKANIEIHNTNDVQACKYYVLPDITGINTGTHCSYFEFSMGGGKIFSAGDTLRSSVKIFVACHSADYCPDEDSFNISIVPAVSSLFTPTDLCPDYRIQIGSVVFDSSHTNDTVVLTGAAANGCDSLVIVQLYFNSPVDSHLVASLCPGQSLSVNNTLYNEQRPSGTEIIRAGAATGCDSTVYINLSYLANASGQYRADICKGDTISVNGDYYHENHLSGLDTIMNAAINGCDSLVDVRLNLIQPQVFNYQGQICSEDSLLIGNVYFHKENLKLTDTLAGASINGCDSIRNIVLQLHPQASFAINQTLCSGEFIIVNGRRYDEARSSGLELLKNGSIYGCDSTIQINLKFQSHVESTYTPVLCENDSISIHGKFYSKINLSGTDTLTGSATGGCDSVVHIIVNLQHNSNSVLNYSICEEDSIVVNGKSYHKNKLTGTEILSKQASSGCDSIINIQLSLLPSATTEIRDTLCKEEHLIINGKTYNRSNSSGTEYFQSMSGCDSIVRINLSFIDLQLSYPTEINLEPGVGQKVTLIPQFNVSRVNWSPATGLSCIDCLDPVINTNQDQLYNVTLYDDQGCSVSIIISVRSSKDQKVFIPNAFSPNGDNINDLFKIKSENPDLKINEFLIFDRWGNQIFQELNSNILNHKGWNGNSLAGDKMNPGVYVYLIKIQLSDQEFRFFRGDVTLLR